MRLLDCFRESGPRTRPTGANLRRPVRTLLQVEALESRTLLNSDQNAFFVTKIYPDLLHRPVDPGALSAFSNMLDRAQITRFDLSLGVESSPEYRNSEVGNLYTQHLHRAATSADLHNG